MNEPDAALAALIERRAAEQDPPKAPLLECAPIGHRALGADSRRAGYLLLETPEPNSRAAVSHPVPGD